jgi:hypothetical protein
VDELYGPEAPLTESPPRVAELRERPNKPPARLEVLEDLVYEDVGLDEARYGFRDIFKMTIVDRCGNIGSRQSMGGM